MSVPAKKTQQIPELTVNDFKSEVYVSTIYIITPEIAERLIEEGTNPLNRPVSDSTVDEYGIQMKKGKWRINGEAIILSIEGLLLDGQHRLWACYKTGKPFITFVTRGVDKETFSTIDTGKKRSGADALIINAKLTGTSQKYATQMSAAATLCIQIMNGTIRNKGGHGKANISRQDVIDFTKKHPDLETWVERSRAKKTHYTNYTSALAAICFLAAKNGYDMKAYAFMHGFITGENLTGRSPIMALRNRLGVDKNLPKVERIALIIHALNKYIDEEELTVVKYSGKEFPLIHAPEKQLQKGISRKKITRTLPQPS